MKTAKKKKGQELTKRVIAKTKKTVRTKDEDPERRLTEEEAEEAAWKPVYRSKYSDEEG